LRNLAELGGEGQALTAVLQCKRHLGLVQTL
jgi:hypothetical protein